VDVRDRGLVALTRCGHAAWSPSAGTPCGSPVSTGWPECSVASTSPARLSNRHRTDRLGLRDLAPMSSCPPIAPADESSNDPAPSCATPSSLTPSARASRSPRHEPRTHRSAIWARRVADDARRSTPRCTPTQRRAARNRRHGFGVLILWTRTDHRRCNHATREDQGAARAA
jgi:hypothetical protein